jgi:signal transduction histidine kinase
MARALIVDDDPVGARLVRKYLQRAGHDVVIRSDGRSGLDWALSHPPDVVILDVMMPEMDGLEVCRALRSVQATRDLPVIFLSARSDLGARVAGLDQGAIDYLVKPVEPDELMARVRAALRTKQLQDELRRANAELRAADQNRQELVSMLAHDIRGLLGAVSSAVEMARADLEELPDRDAHRFLGIAERNTNELVTLATNLLDNYRLDEGRLRPRLAPLDLAEIAEDVVDRLAGQAHHRELQVVVVGEPVAGVIGDRDLLNRVLLNLVSNAVKFSPPGGTITVDLESHLKPPGGSEGVVVSVRDEGPGISVEDRARLFERFTPLALPGGRRPVGSGLGLAFCRKVVDLMGGEIWVESEPGCGSTFAFVLPRTGVAGESQPSKPTTVPATGVDRSERSGGLVLKPEDAPAPTAQTIDSRKRRNSVTR